MINIKFESAALPADTFQVQQFDGEEEISHLFRFELRLVSRDPEIDLALVLQSHAKLSITTQGETRYVHGMLCEFEQGGESHTGLYEYRAVLVPRLWMMTQSTQNQIFQNQNVPDIVENELESVAQKGLHPLAAAGLSGDDYEIYIKPRVKYMSTDLIPEEREYFEREYVVQYKESDFNFISRLMEHEGIYYYFEHDENREKIVITDIMATEQITTQNTAEFQSNTTASRFDNSVVHSLKRSHQQIPSSVLMTDHNYRSPDLPMQASGDVSEDGIGLVTEFGAHFKLPEEGLALADIRAEEFCCQQNKYSGESNIASFASGHLCSLNGHFRGDYNQDYLLTRVKHHGSQDIESWGKVGGTRYYNEFSCIPADLPFRPQRLTPKPKLYGIMNGTIDSEQDLGRADLDEFGRYKVKMPFDMNGAAPGMASRRIRMAQPYGGAGDDGGGIGMSFPLLKGTEVIWTCIDGDIDRPIITGVVPNPMQPSPTNTQNASSNVIKTASGITMSFHDGSSGEAGQHAAGGSAGVGLGAQRQFQRVTSDALPFVVSQKTSSTDPVPAILEASSSDEGRPLVQQQQMINNRFDSGYKQEASTATQWSIRIPYGTPTASETGRMREKKDVYLRMGAPSEWEETEWGGAWGKDGILSYVDGDRNLVTMGDDSHWHYGGSSDYYKSPQFSCFNDSNTEFFLGDAFDFKAGALGEVAVGQKTILNVSNEAEVNFGVKSSFGLAGEYNSVIGPSIELAGDIRKESNSTIDLVCDPEDDTLETAREKVFPMLSALTAAGIATAGIISAWNEGGEDEEAAANEQTSKNVTYAAHALGGICSTIAIYQLGKRLIKQQRADGASRLHMDKEKVSIDVVGVSRSSQREIELNASQHNSSNPVKLNLTSKAGTDDSIVLECGSSKITINPKSIEFVAKEFTFTAGSSILGLKEDDGLTLKGAKGITVASEGITITAGDVNASSGNVNAKNVEANTTKLNGMTST